ncbi:MAG TPA: copper homeostasis protein CutC, partial [Flavobacteriaceae bacterium]|nr:copper homeostasis protein CutC [Flavobacteriaceae bacterium]
MKADIELCKQLGCHGIVSGVLNADNTLDATRTQELIALSKPLPFTFHRAFDEVPNPEETLEKLIELGVSRLLTSGQQTSAEKGIDLLIQLKKQTQDRLTILPGSGINPSNAKLFKEANFKEIHASASVIIETKNSSHYNEPITVSSKEIIRDILKVISLH